jgi:gas vesicle protein
MQRWVVPVLFGALVAAVVAWLFATEQGEEMRRQLAKQGQMMLDQGGKTFDQVSRQVQESAQDALDSGRRLVDKVTR